MGVNFVGMERLQNHSIAVLMLRNRIIHERGLNENHNGLLRQYFPKKEPYKHFNHRGYKEY